MAALLASIAVIAAVAVTKPGVAGAQLVSGDGYTTLAPADGEVVTPGPFTSGQVTTVNVGANPTLSTAGQEAASAPAPTGLYYFEECEDYGGTTVNLPTNFSGCEAGSLDTESGDTTSGAVEAYDDLPIYDLPDGNISPSGPTMTAAPGKCDVAPYYCVIGIFAANPNSGHPGFTYPHLFSAPFQTVVGDGMDQGHNPGDGTSPTVMPTSPSKSTVAANTATEAADGVNAAQITVTLKDTAGNPVTGGKSVTLSQGSGHSTIQVNGTPGSIATTDGSGQAVFTVSDTTAEPVTYTATDTTDTVVVTQTAQVTFAAPVASPSNSSISALSTTVAQGGQHDGHRHPERPGGEPPTHRREADFAQPGEWQLVDHHARIDRVRRPPTHRARPPSRCPTPRPRP